VPVRAPAPEAPTLRELAGLDDGRILLYMGRATTGRGLEEAVDALPDLPEDLYLVVLGYGDAAFLERFWARAEARGVAHRIRFADPVAPHQVPTVAASADLALVAIQPVCLSYRHSLPNKLFEAIQAGVPVVATELPDIAEIVRAHGVGELFPHGDAQAFRDAVVTVLGNPEAYRSGTRRAGEELCWEREARTLVDAYARLCPPAAPAPPLGAGEWLTADVGL
jgi:glycosyltransferase involved in cell wall biosynthesis